MRAETVIQTVKEVLKQPPAIAKDKVRKLCFCLEFSFRNGADKNFSCSNFIVIAVQISGVIVQHLP